ncbi:MAG: type II and III secretion system protein [Phycisphaerales bacterium]
MTRMNDRLEHPHIPATRPIARDTRLCSLIFPLITLSVLVFGSAWVVGCSSNEQRSQSIEMEDPRISQGSMLDAEEDDGLDRIAEAMAGLDEPSISPGVLASLKDRIDRSRQQALLQREAYQQAESAESDAVLNAESSDAMLDMPANAGRLIPLERMSLSEINDLIASISLRFQTEKGYRPALPAQVSALGSPPERVSTGPVLALNREGDAWSMVRFGFVSYLSQLPQLWVQGVDIDQEGVVTPSGELDGIKAMVDGSLEQVRTMRTSLTPRDLSRELIQLSFVNTEGAMKALKGLGISTIAAIDGLPATIEFNQLPMVTVMPGVSSESTNLVGDAESAAGAFGQSTTPNTASDLHPEVNAGPMSELMVLYHPAHPEQFSLVRSILDEHIDRPARLVFVEGLVLEISEEGLEELGVEWSYQQGSADFILGSLDPTGLSDTLTFNNIDNRDLATNWTLAIRALISDGKAEVLSRPSVLTMNNRQAMIRVGEDIPIATSQEGFSGNSNKIAFNFKYLATGILLNIRPRMTESGDAVSMLIDTVVSAQVPGRDLEIRSTDGDLLASAPTVSTRRVQTYARIANKTPFIIGGLVSRDMSIQQDKVPFLGDLPLIGPAFRSQRQINEKREVIIVLTPYVLPEDQIISRALPKDDDLFDSTGNQLFRDAYRIRDVDVFDLRFLAENKRLMIYRELAADLIEKNFQFADVSPFDEFAGDTIPGEEILIQRMIYELIKRTRVDERINPERMIYFEAKDYEGYNVRFLNYMLTKLGDGETPQSFFDLNPDKAIAITYTYARESLDQRDLASEPIPEVSLVDCPNRDAWQQLLWDMNQPNSSGLDRYTILIKDQRDIERLQRAIMLKKIVLLNGGMQSLSLANFTIGKILHTPKMGEDNVSVIDADVARYFFHTELYYAAIIKRIEETLKEFDTALEDPSVQMFLDPASRRNEPLPGR